MLFKFSLRERIRCSFCHASSCHHRHTDKEVFALELCNEIVTIVWLLGIHTSHSMISYVRHHSFRAIQKFTNAVKVDPTYVRAFVCRGEAYHKIHDVSMRSYIEYLYLKI